MSTNNMAKRTAAGTLALAVCIGGGSLALAGAAQATVPTTSAVTTPGAADTAAAQVVKSSGQSLDNVTIPLGTAAWALNDRIVVQMPAGVQFNGTPTVTAVKVSGTGTTAPTVSVAQLASTDDPATNTASADAVAATRQYAISFTNGQGTSSADIATSWKLVVSGIKVDIATSYGLVNSNNAGTSDSISLGGSVATSSTQANNQSATYDWNGKVYGQTYDSNAGTWGGTKLYTGETLSSKALLGYLQSASVSVPSGFSFVNGGKVQAAPDVTITEALAASFVNGSLSLGFVDSLNRPVILDTSSLTIAADSFSPSLSVNGTAATSGAFTPSSTTFTATQTGTTVGATYITSPTVTATTAVDKIVVGNLRFSGKAYDGAAQVDAVGPIKAILVSPASTVVQSASGSAPLSGDITINDPNSRLGGASRYDTAAQIVATRFSVAPTAKDFVLASGDGSGVDALSANYVGGVGTDRPVVLTAKNYLPDATLAYLKSAIGAGNTTAPVSVKFTVLGGRAAIDDSVMGMIKDAFPTASGYNVTFNRYAGDDRYETAATAAINMGGGSVASFSNTYGKAAVRTAILASGENSADAVAAGGIAYGANFPLLLTAQGDLPSSTVNAINTLEIKQVIIVGGPKAISTAVEDKLKSMGVTVIRKFGDDRFGTALQIAEFARTPVNSTDTKVDAGLGWNGAAYSSTGTTWTNTAVVPLLGNGYGSADILAAGQLSANTGPAAYRPILTSDGGGLSDSTKKWLTDHKASISNVTGLGGASAISWDTLTAAVNAQK